MNDTIMNTDSIDYESTINQALVNEGKHEKVWKYTTTK